MGGGCDGLLRSGRFLCTLRLQYNFHLSRLTSLLGKVTHKACSIMLATDITLTSGDGQPCAFALTVDSGGELRHVVAVNNVIP